VSGAKGPSGATGRAIPDGASDKTQGPANIPAGGTVSVVSIFMKVSRPESVFVTASVTAAPLNASTSGELDCWASLDGVKGTMLMQTSHTAASIFQSYSFTDSFNGVTAGIHTVAVTCRSPSGPWSANAPASLLAWGVG
jgi:hypothetical protein